ncbi:hypothetical protein [Anabaena sp. CCY 0017]
MTLNKITCLRRNPPLTVNIGGGLRGRSSVAIIPTLRLRNHV